jgi:hypothetical protein
LFDPAERLIFPYRRRGGDVFGDPDEIGRRLDALLGDTNKVLAGCHDVNPLVCLPSYELLGRATCEAFRLGEPFSEETGVGVTEREWLGVLNQFVEWREKNASRAGDSPAGSRPTNGLPADPSRSSTGIGST